MKTSSKDFVYFVSVCKEWVARFGITHYRIDYFHRKNMDNARASFSTDTSGKCCSIFLEVDWGFDKPTRESLRKAAIHEVLHLLLCDLTTEARFRFTTKDDLEEREHEVIRRLENIL